MYNTTPSSEVPCSTTFCGRGGGGRGGGKQRAWTKEFLLTKDYYLQIRNSVPDILEKIFNYKTPNQLKIFYVPNSAMLQISQTNQGKASWHSMKSTCFAVKYIWVLILMALSHLSAMRNWASYWGSKKFCLSKKKGYYYMPVWVRLG